MIKVASVRSFDGKMVEYYAEKVTFGFGSGWWVKLEKYVDAKGYGQYPNTYKSVETLVRSIRKVWKDDTERNEYKEYPYGPFMQV